MRGRAEAVVGRMSPDVLARGLICLCAGALPLVMLPQAPDAFGIPKFTLVVVTTILAAALVAVARLERFLPGPIPRSIWPFVAFVVVMAIATVRSVNPVLSLIGLPKRHGGFTAYFIYATLSVLVVILYRSRATALSRVVFAVIIGATLSAVYVLAQKWNIDIFEWRTAYGRSYLSPFGSLGQSNFAGGYLGIVVPLVVYAAMTTRGWRRVFFAGVGAIDVAALWFTRSRGGLLALGAGLVVFVFVLRGRMPRIVQTAAALAVVVGLLFGASVLSRTDRPLTEPGLRRADDTVLRADTTRVRIFYWRAALNMAAERPVLGWGPDTYGMLYGRHRTPEDGAELGLFTTDKPHSVLLEHLVNAGIIGLIAYLVVAGSCLAKGYAAARRMRSSDQILAGAIVASLAAYLAQSVVSIDVPSLAATGWLLMGAAVACAEASRAPPAVASAARGTPANTMTVAIVILAASVLTVLALRPLRANLQLGAALRHSTAAGKTAELTEALEEAVRLHPWDPGIRAELAIFYTREAEGLDAGPRGAALERAVAQELEAWRLQPGKVQYAINVARLYEGLADTGDVSYFERSASWWRRAVAVDPYDWSVHAERGLLLQAWAEATDDDSHLPASARSLERALEISPKHPALWKALGQVYEDLGEGRRAAEAFKRFRELPPTTEPTSPE